MVKGESEEPPSKEEIEEVRKELRRINERLDTLFSEMTSVLRLQNRALIRATMGPRIGVEISDAMKKTLNAVVDMCDERESKNETPRVTATEVAKRTGRAPTLESAYLSRLERAGYLDKERDGRTMYYKYTA